MSLSIASRVQPATMLMSSFPRNASIIAISLNVASTWDGSTPRMITCELLMAETLSSRVICTFSYREKTNLRRLSEDSLDTQAMNWVMPQKESGGAFKRLWRMEVPRLPDRWWFRGLVRDMSLFFVGGTYRIPACIVFCLTLSLAKVLLPAAWETSLVVTLLYGSGF